MRALMRRNAARFVVLAIPAVSVFLLVAGGLAAGRSSNALGGPGDRASDVQDPQVVRLVPGTQSLTSDELSAFRRVISDLAPDSIPVAHGRTEFDGESWSFTTWRNRANELCGGTNVPGEGHGRSCVPVDQLFAERPVRLGRGAHERSDGWHAVWIEGLVAPQVRSLLMVTADCEQRPIDVDSAGAFFHLIPGAEAVAGEWPIRVEAYDAAGRVLSTTRLPVTRPDAESPLAPDQPICP